MFLVEATETQQELHFATFVHDISIGLRWFLVEGEYDFPMTDHLANPTVRRVDLEILFMGAVVDRQSGVVVDGGRSMVPWPKMVTAPDPDAQHGVAFIADKVTSAQTTLWRLVRRLEAPHLDNFDEVFVQTKLVVVEGGLP